jgi:hypothetical protein
MLREMEIQHFSHEEHPLMLVEELENEDVCSGCDKSVSCGPAYKCSHCDFLLHQSCADLPLEIQRHPVHPKHTLVLKFMPNWLRICKVCGKNCVSGFFYRCNSCNFGLDIECASASWPTKPDDCYQHEFVPIFQEIQFTCKLCGEDWSGDAQVCLVCRHLAHTLCALKRRSINIMEDRHVVTLIYSLGKVFKEHDHAFCYFCGRKVNLKYAGYYCQKCDFVAHLECAVKNPFDPIVIGITYSSDSSIESDVNEDIYLEEDEDREEVKRFYHEHKLILSRNEVEVDHHKLICEGCMQSISAPFYSCEQCHYFLHSTCARLPLKKRHPIHPHKLTLSATGNFTGGLTFCYACRRLSHGFAYVCHRLDCGYSMDIRCCSIPKIFKHDGHEHPLSFAKRSTEMCNACDHSSDTRIWSDGSVHDGVVFVCNECEFALDFDCATLPLKAKCEYHPHPLTLTYEVENDSEEHYCLICEEERNTNHWFYYCVECNFAAHPQCAIGQSPYIKYEINFTDKDHQHPFNFAWRTKNSRPCDACGETFEGKNTSSTYVGDPISDNETYVGDMALNCTQCKSIIHWDYKCIRKLGETS